MRRYFLTLMIVLALPVLSWGQQAAGQHVLPERRDTVALDAVALDTIRQAYPDREMVGIDCRAVIRQHGSLHCCTMQYY